jgi:hypothetical protein
MSSVDPFAFGVSAFGVGSFGPNLTPSVPQGFTPLENTMLTSTIKSYLYQQYANDDSLQAFANAYNLATQNIVTWLSSVNLAYYPGLSGPLLDWVAEGLYGMRRTSLESPATGNFGPLNTEALNTSPLNSFIPSTQTYYALNDDMFQRIMTWNFYKGDGNRFTMRWLKRRIMRFLVGANGIDPEPWNPGFVVGAENTTAISAVISGETLTVTINQALLSSLVQVVPNVLTIFQLAFEGGILELPAELTSLVVNIETLLTATVAPLAETAVGSTASITTGVATVSVSGGSGEYTYAWAFTTGGTGITIDSPTASNTAFTASGLSIGSGVTGTATCTVTDTITTNTTTVSLPVSIERGSAPTATIAPSSLTVVGASASLSTGSVMVSVTGGATPYTYIWTWNTGGAGININSPTANATTFTATVLSPGTTDSGTAQCVVTDAYGQTSTVTIPVSISRATLVTATSTGGVSVTGASSSETTSLTEAVASGGVGPYTYSWAWQTGGSGIMINDPTAAVTDFTATGLAAGTVLSGVAVCTVKDTLSQSAQVTATVSITRVSLVSATVSPASESSSGNAATQTTGFSTVTPSGGSGTYIYAWAWSSGGTGITINSPSSNRTSFTASGMALGASLSGVARCTVTDAYGQTATTTVSVAISYIAVQVISETVGGVGISPADGSAAVLFNSGGTEEIINNANPTGLVVGNWLEGGVASNYQIMATLQSGTAPNWSAYLSPLNTWIPLSSGATWGMQRTTVGSTTGTLLIEIALVGSTTPLASGTVTLTGTVVNT